MFLPQAVDCDHAVEVAITAAEAAAISAANARRAVDQLTHQWEHGQEVARQAAAVAVTMPNRKIVEVPAHAGGLGGFTMYEMSRISRELVRANSA